MVTERRREKRINARLPIRISYPDSPPIYIQTEDISRKGIYAEIERQIPLGVRLDIAIEIPTYTNELSLIGGVRCRGDVFRCNLIREVESKRFYGLGVLFTDFSDEKDKNKLLKYIDFLILKEQDIKQAIKRWSKRRGERAG